MRSGGHQTCLFVGNFLVSNGDTGFSVRNDAILLGNLYVFNHRVLSRLSVIMTISGKKVTLLRNSIDYWSEVL